MARMLFRLRIGVCVLTETHLRERDLSKFKIRHYDIISSYCRVTENRIGGGVLILAHATCNIEKYTLPGDVPSPLETCSAKLFPTMNPDAVLILTGIYIPPGQTRELSMKKLETLCEPCLADETSTPMSHILTGDLNTRTWSDLYEEWCSHYNLWDLCDPTEPTYTSGSTIDKMLFLAGGYIPSTFASPVTTETGPAGSLETHHFPAVVLSNEAISDHFPILLSIPSEVNPGVPAERRYFLDDLTEEQWAERTEILGELLARDIERLDSLYRANNVHHYQALLEKICVRTLADDYQQVLTPERRDPLTSFLRHHTGHKDLPALITALEERDEETTDALLNRICSDGWCAYLRTVTRSNTQSFFAYLAKAEGRKRWA